MEVDKRIIPYLLIAIVCALFVRRQFAMKDILILAGIGYALYFFYIERVSSDAASEAVTQQFLAENVARGAPKMTKYLVEHEKFSAILEYLYERFDSENGVLREATMFLSHFVDYHRRFTAGKRFDVTECQHIWWTLRMAINAFASLDMQIQDPRPYRRGHLHTAKRETGLHKKVDEIEMRVRSMFSEISEGSSIDSEHFAVAPSNSWEEAYADRWMVL